MRRLVIVLMLCLAPAPLTNADITILNDAAHRVHRVHQVSVVHQVRQQLSMRGFNREQWRCAAQIVYRESRFHPNSFNASSGAVGLFQIKNLPRYFGVKRQVARAVKYLNARYGSDWCAALRFHTANGWW